MRDLVMAPVTPPDDPQTMWDHFLRSWPIFAGVIGFLLAGLGILARLVFGHVVEELKANTKESGLLRKDISDLKSRLSRIEGYLDAQGRD